MNSNKKLQAKKCASGTLPIAKQIVSGQIVKKALPNEFGILKISGEDIAYFNYNNIYSGYNIGDKLFFFITDKSNVIIKTGNSVKQYPDGVQKLAFNLHTPQKSLSIQGGPLKGSNTDIPPTIQPPPDYTGGATSFGYVINDCGDILVMEANKNMVIPWQRCTLKPVCNICNPIVYAYNGNDSGVWTP